MSKTRNRRLRTPGGADTYDGVTDWQIFERDGWKCRMPECLHPVSRRIYPGFPLDHPYRASIDHIRQLSNGGSDRAQNKRAAHAKCNEAHDRKPSRRTRGRMKQRFADAPGAARLAALFGEASGS